MSRLPRICSIGIAQHIIQRGNNRQICFCSEQNFLLMWVGLKSFLLPVELIFTLGHR
jgi:putative transposase